VKGLAQLVATLAREFSYALLHAVSPWDEGTVPGDCTSWWKQSFSTSGGYPPHATYLFKHTLIQDTAYQSLLRSTRQQYHQRIAQVLKARFPESCETQPELLAHHYTEVCLGAQAIGYWQRAGQRAVERSTYAEALGHLTTGLELLTTLPDTPARAQQELDFQWPWNPVDGHQGQCGSRGGASLQPGARCVTRSARRRASNAYVYSLKSCIGRVSSIRQQPFLISAFW
jgi:hypothetical protein